MITLTGYEIMHSGGKTTVFYDRELQQAAAAAIVEWYKAACPLWFWDVY